ncbi:MAG: ATP-binding cassette domain-containing protein [Alphaproteobacteria bacterium]|nr:ATP-binding cassette domain-containing protein [Alphaproteobacteria bacterium]
MTLPTWPIAEAPRALAALAEAAGLGVTPAPEVGDAPMEAVAASMGLEVEATVLRYPEVDDALLRLGPALLRPTSTPEEALVLLGARRGRLVLLGPDGRRHRVALAPVRAALVAHLEARVAPVVARTLGEVMAEGPRRARVARALFVQLLQGAPCEGVWQLRLPPEAPLARQGWFGGLGRALAALLGASALAYGLHLLSWALIGRAALQGRLDAGWSMAWVLVLLTLLPTRLLVTWSQGVFTLGGGTLLKRRLLQGALRMDPEAVKREGVGRSVGRVHEAEAVERLALSGGIAGALATLELVGAAGVLAVGAGGLPHALLLLGWTALLLGLARRFTGRLARWTAQRVAMSSALVEQMIGHRTRLAQQPQARWHEDEDQELTRALACAAAMDRDLAHLLVTGPRAWMLLGLLGLAGPFLAGTPQSGLALGLGGVLLAEQALRRLTAGLAQLAGAAVAHERLRPLLDAARRRPAVGQPGAWGPRDPAAPLIDARGVGFRYDPRRPPVITGCSLRIGAGERVLVEGASGGGKSTLAALVAGLRTPEVGLLLCGGLDRATLGAAGWRRRVVAAPQHHENHVLANTLAFNLLMGRRWPPPPGDLEEAEAVCAELGLGPLLARMPAGLMQRVGETGWQLSHGEQSRVFVARALLQGADLVVLDESFVALDPETLRAAMACVWRRAPALLVVAHP